MRETYMFYVQMEGQTYGRYTAKAIRELDLLGDILVTEESMNGRWLPASKFDFDDMVRKEQGDMLSQHTSQSMSQQIPSTNYSTVGADNVDNPSPTGWCVLALLFPLVGWILYFCWRRTKPRKASAVCTWAWIGFVINIIVAIVGM